MSRFYGSVCMCVIEPSWNNISCALVDFNTLRRLKCSLGRTYLSPYLKYFNGEIFRRSTDTLLLIVVVYSKSNF